MTFPLAKWGARLPTISSGAGTDIGGTNSDRPAHQGADIDFARLPSDPPYSGHDGPEGTRRFVAPPIGHPALAYDAGRVIISKEISSGGYVKIWHAAKGVYSQYMHLAKRLVSEGQMVKDGQVVGHVGDDPRPERRDLRHLHFEIVNADGRKRDPRPLLDRAPIVPAPTYAIVALAALAGAFLFWRRHA